jgi:hydroxyacylglutathione hydrolase
MQIRMLTTGPLGTNAYLLTDSQSDEALLVDAPQGAYEEVQNLLEGSSLRIGAILLTHGHWDHTYDLAAFQKAGAVVHAHLMDQHLIEHPEVMTALMPGDLRIEPARIDVPVKDGQKLYWWGQEVEVRHVPGHCPGNVLFYFAADKAAFVGDAIFAGSIGRYDLPGGDFEELDRSIRSRIYTLPDEVVLYPGHGTKTTVGVEKKQNPFVQE